jgi:hypothetical protein
VAGALSAGSGAPFSLFEGGAFADRLTTFHCENFYTHRPCNPSLTPANLYRDQAQKRPAHRTYPGPQSGARISPLNKVHLRAPQLALHQSQINYPNKPPAPNFQAPFSIFSFPFSSLRVSVPRWQILGALAKC